MPGIQEKEGQAKWHRGQRRKRGAEERGGKGATAKAERKEWHAVTVGWLKDLVESL